MLPRVYPTGLRKLRLLLLAALAACGGGGGGGSSSSPASSSPAPATSVLETPAFTRGFAQFAGAPGATAAGDLDGDGRDDLVVVTSGAGSDSVYVFYQRANGPESMSSPTASAGARSAAVCDIDGDGRSEILVGYSSGDLTVYRPGADGRPALAQTMAGIASARIVCADLDGDGASDVITTGKPGAALQVLLQRSGTLVEQASFAGDPIAVLDVGDVNGDGLPDIVFAASSGLMAYLQTAAGQFAAPVALAFAGMPPAASGIAVLGRGVVASTDGQVLIASQDAPAVSLPTMANASYLRVRDIDGDGRADIAVFHDGALGIYFQNADGTFGAEQTLATYPADPSTGAPAIAFGDFDGDGRLDIAVASQTAVSLFFQDVSP